MDRVLNISTATAGAGTSAILDLDTLANASSEEARVLRVDLQYQVEGGGFTGVLVEHSTDATTWATLWSMGALSSLGSNYRYLYTYRRYLRISYTYTAGGTTEDPGGRFQVRFRVFGMPDWNQSVPCRWEHCEAYRPSWFVTADGFDPQYDRQRNAAKTRLEHLLKARGIDARALFTDGNDEEPVPIGLEYAGALLTLLIIHADAGMARGDAWEQEHAALLQEFTSSFEAACASGLMLTDKGPDGSAEDGDATYSEPLLTR